jgi:calcineurin-like phosphoesterase family protein
LIFFTSDTHFGDPRVLALDRRPFSSLQAHDEALVEFWNETVGADDVVWHLGDFARTTS